MVGCTIIIISNIQQQQQHFNGFPNNKILFMSSIAMNINITELIRKIKVSSLRTDNIIEYFKFFLSSLNINKTSSVLFYFSVRTKSQSIGRSHRSIIIFRFPSKPYQATEGQLLHC